MADHAITSEGRPGIAYDRESGFAGEKAAKLQQEPPFLTALRRNGHVTDDLAAALTNLEERLAPLLSQPVPERAIGEDVEMHPGDSDLVNQMNAQAHNQHMQVLRVHRLLDRLEL